MRRRDFITLIGGAAAWPITARAQQPKRVGVLMIGTSDDAASNIAIFTEQLRKLGWVEGQNVHIDYRSGESDEARLRAFAVEIVALSPDVILAGGHY